VDRELLGLGKLDAGPCQRGLQAAIPRLLPGALRFPDLTDAKVWFLAEQDVELEGWRGSVGAVLLKDLVDLVVLLARQRRRRVPDEDRHDPNLTDRTVLHPSIGTDAAPFSSNPLAIGGTPTTPIWPDAVSR
jgi:hypothetical protein